MLLLVATLQKCRTVKSLIDPGIIYDILLKEYESVMTNPKDVKVIKYEDGFNKGLAQKFAFYYQRDKNENIPDA